MTNQKVRVVGTGKLLIRMGEASVRILFRLKHNLAFSALLETTFTDKFEKGIFLFGRTIVPYNSQPIPIKNDT